MKKFIAVMAVAAMGLVLILMPAVSSARPLPSGFKLTPHAIVCNFKTAQGKPTIALNVPCWGSATLRGPVAEPYTLNVCYQESISIAGPWGSMGCEEIVGGGSHVSLRSAEFYMQPNFWYRTITTATIHLARPYPQTKRSAAVRIALG